jgi:hypothetical protein
MLREMTVIDGGHRITPTPRTVLAADADAAAELLTSSGRRLPAVVVTTFPSTNRPLVDVEELSRELAGLAHVLHFRTHLAAQRLTEILGRELSVWHGAVRIYWPGFRPGEPGGRHRYWLPQALTSDPIGLVHQLTRWVGGRAAAAVPEHPNHARLRLEQLQNLESLRDQLPDWAAEYVKDLETQQLHTESESKRLQIELADSQARVEEIQAELRDVRAAFLQLNLPRTLPDLPANTEEIDWDQASVLEAYDLAKSQAGTHVVYLSGADESIQRFTEYRDPHGLYEALQCVSRAADAWNDDTLGNGFADYFRHAGYEFSARNPAARTRKNRGHYQVEHQGRSIVLGPHLKVDQSAAPDQCLRIYWYQSPDDRTLVIGHVGRHLPN